jgi:hypothetical protein
LQLHRRVRWSTVGAVAGVVVVATALQLLYQTGTEPWRSIWAEDGSEYFQRAHDHGLGAFTYTYAGYLQTLPRLLALPTPLLPFGSLAVYFACAGALATTLCALAVYVLAATWVPSRALRAVLALACVFHPVMAFENLANITNTIWPLTFACFWALLHHPKDRPHTVLAAGVAALAVLSNALTALFLPIAVVMGWRCRDKRHRIVLAAYGGALVLQTIAVLFPSDSSLRGHASHLPQLYVVRVLSSALVGEKWLRDLWLDGGYTLVLPFAVIVAAGVLTLAWRVHGVRRIVGAAAVAYSVVMFVVPVVIRGTEAMPLAPGNWFSGGARYAGLAILLLLSAVCVMVEGLHVQPRQHTWLVAAVAVPVIVISVFGFRFENQRSAGPNWRASLREAGARCAAEQLDIVRIGVAPFGTRLSVYLRCRDLR